MERANYLDEHNAKLQHTLDEYHQVLRTTVSVVAASVKSLSAKSKSLISTKSFWDKANTTITTLRVQLEW